MSAATNPSFRRRPESSQSKPRVADKVNDGRPATRELFEQLDSGLRRNDDLLEMAS